MKMTAKERLLSHIEMRGTEECWPWNAAIGVWGYGVFWYEGKNLNASRAAYMRRDLEACLKTSTGSPTKAERERWARFEEIGCICCLLSFGQKQPRYEVHHLLQGGRRLGHLYSIPLCETHHRGRSISGLWTSIAQGSKAFNAVHGSQWDLWVKTQHILQLSDELPASKLVSRRL